MTRSLMFATGNIYSTIGPALLLQTVLTEHPYDRCFLRAPRREGREVFVRGVRHR